MAAISQRNGEKSSLSNHSDFPSQFVLYLNNKMSQSIFRRKSIEAITAAPEETEATPTLRRILTWRDVLSHGIAAIIGTGIFVLTGVAAHDYAGPGIILSFAIAGICCGFVSFSYAELASMIPVSGSAYTYAYASLGEIVAFCIGWDLLLEYAVGSSAVAVGWSAYLQNLLRSVGIHLPEAISHAPATVPWIPLVGGACAIGCFVALWRNYESILATFGLAFSILAVICTFNQFTSIDLPALLIIVFINYWLVKGVKHTARMTAVFVVVKLAVILLFIGLGIWHIQPANYVPFMPFGFHGVLAGASIVFFAFIGFDAVTTLSEECRDPQRDVSKGVKLSLLICTAVYIIVAAVMVGDMSYKLLGGNEIAAPMAAVLNYIGYWWASPLVSIGAIAGITSVLIVLLFGQSRIMMKMAQDGLMPSLFGKISRRYRTPRRSILTCGAIIACMSGLLPIGELAELTNIGTLAAFAIVCVGVLVLRQTEPNRERKFRCPGYPLVPVLGVLSSLALMAGLPAVTWLRFVIWFIAGLFVYYFYGRKHSLLNRRTAT